jgi:DNA polymerase-3 subunit epsilon
MRQIVLDTETTGLAPGEGHRIIEIGCVELLNRRHTGRHFHRYLNPERDIEAGAMAVHGLSREKLAQEPRFAEIARELLEFLGTAELVIHNAEFDLAFLDMELSLLAAIASPDSWPASVRAVCTVIDTLALARERHPGQRNNLDALCKRYGIDHSHREQHGALLDAQLLAEVYLAMTGGQSLLALERQARALSARDGASAQVSLRGAAEVLTVVMASAEELAAHEELTKVLQKASGGRCLWLSAAQTPSGGAS